MKDKFGHEVKSKSRMEKKSSFIITKTDGNGVEYEVANPDLYDLDGNYHKPRRKSSNNIAKKKKRK